MKAGYGSIKYTDTILWRSSNILSGGHGTGRTVYGTDHGASSFLATTLTFTGSGGSQHIR